MLHFQQRDFTQTEKQFLQKETSRWKAMGVLKEVEYSPRFQLNPIHVIPKGDPKKPRGFRVIVNNSYPKGISVNDIIPDFCKKCTLLTFEDIVQWVMKLGPGGYVAAMDLSEAWKQFRILPSDTWMSAWVFEGRIFIETSLPFGFGAAVKIFTWIDKSILWIFLKRVKEKGVVDLRKENSKIVIFYIDDLSVGTKSKKACARLFEELVSTCTELGLKFNPKKTNLLLNIQ